MDDEASSPSKKGWLKKSFKGAVGVVKELAVHSVIHFTLWGSIFASNFAAFLTPIFNPLGEGITYLAEQVGLEHLFTESSGGGAQDLSSKPEADALPEMDSLPELNL